MGFIIDIGVGWDCKNEHFLAKFMGLRINLNKE